MDSFNNLNERAKSCNHLFENYDHNGITMESQKNGMYYRHMMNESSQVVYAYKDRKYENQKQTGIEFNFLGYPASGQIIDIYGISISYFEFGAIVTGMGISEPLICRYIFPKIGNPGIVNPERGYELKNYIRGTFGHIKKSVYDQIIEKRPQFFEEIFSDVFFLKPVSSHSITDDILLVPEVRVETVNPVASTEREVIISLSFSSRPSVPLHDKTLFDLVFRCVNDFTLAPHGIFANKNWDNFVMMHVTDIHVSRRIEYAKDDLKKMSSEKPDLINEVNIRHFNNFNDNFRDFISFANSLHKQGSLDCILATGDLIDYLFDSTEQTAKTVRDIANIDTINGNNFDFFKRLVLGLEPGRDGTKNEELLVPIFTSLGNHDYRAMPYPWAGQLNPALMTGGTEGAIEGAVIGGVVGSLLGVGPLGAVLGGLLGGLSDEEIPIPFVENKDLSFYKPTNLFLPEAIALEGGEQPVFGPKRAIAMATVIESLPQYNMINTKRSYIVRLGPHRIVMLDSAYDVGIIDTNLDVFLHVMGRDSDDSKRFAQATANSKGVIQDHINLLKQALTEAGSTGIVIVGIHAPLVDIGYYPYYLRETDRIAPNPTVMERGFPYFAPFFSKEEGYEANGQMPGWQLTGSNFFKSGDLDYTLEDGVSKGLNKEFLEICTGVGVSRKVDLVLSGHGHKNVEFRLGFQPDSGFLFFHDYYTENPARYYATKLLLESDFVKFKEDFKGDEDDKEEIFKNYVKTMVYCLTIISEGFRVTRHSIMRDHMFDPVIVEELAEVPPYPTPLNKTDNKVLWWSQHRPLLLQTTSLGPIETINSGIESPRGQRLADRGLFHGCRKITIKNNIISSIEVVHMNDIRGSRSRLCSLKELCRVRGISFPASIRNLAKDIQSITPISDRMKIG